MTKFNTRHQSVSKSKRQSGTKNIDTSSQMLLDHGYIFSLLL